MNQIPKDITFLSLLIREFRRSSDHGICLFISVVAVIYSRQVLTPNVCDNQAVWTAIVRA